MAETPDDILLEDNKLLLQLLKADNKEWQDHNQILFFYRPEVSAEV